MVVGIYKKRRIRKKKTGFREAMAMAMLINLLLFVSTALSVVAAQPLEFIWIMQGFKLQTTITILTTILSLWSILQLQYGNTTDHDDCIFSHFIAKQHNHNRNHNHNLKP